MIQRVYKNLPKELNECARCHLALPLSEYTYSKSNKNHLHSNCRICRRPTKEQRANWDQDLVKAGNKRWRDRNPEYFKNLAKITSSGRRWQRYKITECDYQEMLSRQDSKCAICGIKQSELAYPLNVDHCHTTGKVRGLLCQSCNLGIGRMKDNISVLKSAIAYLDKYLP